MPDILTKPEKCICGYGRYSYVEPNCPVHGQKIAEAVSGGKNQSSVDSGAVTATPETITISLPALRAVVLGVIDDGCTRHHGSPPWYFGIREATEAFHDQERLDFCDEIERRLRQLPARG